MFIAGCGTTRRYEFNPNNPIPEPSAVVAIPGDILTDRNLTSNFLSVIIFEPKNDFKGWPLSNNLTIDLTNSNDKTIKIKGQFNHLRYEPYNLTLEISGDENFATEKVYSQKFNTISESIGLIFNSPEEMTNTGTYVNTTTSGFEVNKILPPISPVFIRIRLEQKGSIFFSNCIKYLNGQSCNLAFDIIKNTFNIYFMNDMLINVNRGISNFTIPIHWAFQKGGLYTGIFNNYGYRDIDPLDGLERLDNPRCDALGNKIYMLKLYAKFFLYIESLYFNSENRSKNENEYNNNLKYIEYFGNFISILSSKSGYRMIESGPRIGLRSYFTELKVLSSKSKDYFVLYPNSFKIKIMNRTIDLLNNLIQLTPSASNLSFDKGALDQLNSQALHISFLIEIIELIQQNNHNYFDPTFKDFINGTKNIADLILKETLQELSNEQNIHNVIDGASFINTLAIVASKLIEVTPEFKSYSKVAVQLGQKANIIGWLLTLIDIKLSFDEYPDNYEIAGVGYSITNWLINTFGNSDCRIILLESLCLLGSNKSMNYYFDVNIPNLTGNIIINKNIKNIWYNQIRNSSILSDLSITIDNLDNNSVK